jgi:hypothetical protein
VGAPEPTSSLPQVRASQWLNRVAWLRKSEHYNAVRALLDRDSQALLDAPPLGAAWLAYTVTEALDVAIEKHGGLALVRKCGYESTVAALPMFAPLVQGFARLFGLKPGTFLSRMQSFAEATTKGILYEYRETHARAGEMVMSMPAAKNVATAFFVSGAGAMSTTFEVCGVKTGVVDDPRIEGALHNRAVFALRW